ncbi:hypothetical protein FXO38_05776 [Capsicum annuum]|nr:hypothetical protein FXO38_05776 [Capsicum annuum]
MPFFLTLRSVQILPDPKVVVGIKMELFGATTITKKIILEGGLIAVGNGSGSGSGSDATVGANDAPLIIFETTSHYDYDHTGYTNFSPDFSTCSKYSACKCQDCKVKHDGVINTINALTASIKKMASNMGVFPSKRISYPYTPLEIKAAKRRRKDTSKASSNIEISKITMPLSLSYADVQCVRAIREKHEPKKVDVTVEATAKEHNVTVDNPSTAFKEEEKHIDVIFYYLQKKDKLQIQEQYRYTTGNYLYKVYINNAYDRNCGPFVTAYAEYLSDELQVPNGGLDDGLLHKRYAALLWKYGEAKSQKPYSSDVKDPRRPKLNFVTPDEEKLVHID